MIFELMGSRILYRQAGIPGSAHFENCVKRHAKGVIALLETAPYRGICSHSYHYRSAVNVSRILYGVAPLSGRHYHLYLRFVTSLALCNGHVMTVGPKTFFFSTNSESTTVIRICKSSCLAHFGLTLYDLRNPSMLIQNR